MSKIHIGTSGWSYRHWRGVFYPEDLPGDRYLRYYARLFGAVEVNSTFYKLPDRSTLADWREQTPKGFVFACKASRYITHFSKLKDPQASLGRFFDAMDVLGEKCGPLLFQLPPRWHVNVPRLANFLRMLSPRHRCAFEFREESWFTADVYSLLEKHAVANCIYDLGGQVSPLRTTGGFVYVRLHGPKGPYRGCYSERTLESWAERLLAWQHEGKDAFCFFDNDERGYAATNARRLLELTGQASGSVQAKTQAGSADSPVDRRQD